MNLLRPFKYTYTHTHTHTHTHTPATDCPRCWGVCGRYGCNDISFSSFSASKSKFALCRCGVMEAGQLKGGGGGKG